MVANVKEDLWIHKSKMMLCATCMYFVPKSSEVTDNPNQGIKIGRCRRHAPTMSGWPANFPEDWCGDHKLDVNKI